MRPDNLANADDLSRLNGAPRRTGRNKYAAQPVTRNDGLRFASKKEARRYAILEAMQQAGEIRDLIPHPSFVLEVNGYRIGRYTADASYVVVETGLYVVEDCKGGRATKTEAYGLRKRLMRALYMIEIQEV